MVESSNAVIAVPTSLEPESQELESPIKTTETDGKKRESVESKVRA